MTSGARATRAAGGAAPRAKYGSRSNHDAAVHGGGGGERNSSHARRKEQPKWLIPVAVLVLVGGAALVWAMTSSTPSTTTFKRALDLVNAGRFDEAIAKLKSIPEDDPMHSRALEEITRVSGLRAAGEAQFDARDADALFGSIQSLRKDYVERAGPTSKEYTPYCRYMLKKAKDFLNRFPADPRCVEVKGLFPYYAKVATLDTPPTADDVSAEIFLRSFSRQFKEALPAIAEYAQLPGADTVQVARLRGELKDYALSAWRIDFIEPLTRGGDLEPGKENWKRIATRADKYLASVDGVDGVSADAIEWKAKAALALGAAQPAAPGGG